MHRFSSLFCRGKRVKFAEKGFVEYDEDEALFCGVATYSYCKTLNSGPLPLNSARSIS